MLSKTAPSGEQYLVNPIGRCFGFRTLDPVLNAESLSTSIK
ncbi:hypothetical protein FHT80_006386 [Rhizobium sp. BK226]|nr:hypothetical protein [Rhizobium sp. BK226]MBB4117005.1 hypothetical protein [Rhizobium sp. BK226]